MAGLARCLQIRQRAPGIGCRADAVQVGLGQQRAGGLEAVVKRLRPPLVGLGRVARRALAGQVDARQQQRGLDAGVDEVRLLRVETQAVLDRVEARVDDPAQPFDGLGRAGRHAQAEQVHAAQHHGRLFVAELVPAFLELESRLGEVTGLVGVEGLGQRLVVACDPVAAGGEPLVAGRAGHRRRHRIRRAAGVAAAAFERAADRGRPGIAVGAEVAEALGLVGWTVLQAEVTHIGERDLVLGCRVAAHECARRRELARQHLALGSGDDGGVDAAIALPGDPHTFKRLGRVLRPGGWRGQRQHQGKG